MYGGDPLMTQELNILNFRFRCQSLCVMAELLVFISSRRLLTRFIKA